MSNGIDYGRGTTNIDHDMGIRYGVIPQHDVLQSWADSAEPDYGDPHCPKCGNYAVLIQAADGDFNPDIPDLDDDPQDWEDNGRDHACMICKYTFDSDDAYGNEPLSWTLDDEGIQATQGGDDCDIFVIKSPFYTYGPFCSPCAPGAVYLRDASDKLTRGDNGNWETGEKAYCFPPDWFDWWPEMGEPTGEYEGQKTSCPYPVFRVSDDVCIFTPTKGG